MRSIGADHVIDYTQEDFTRAVEQYDLLLDIIGNHSLARCRRVLVAKGRYVMVGAPAGRWIKPMGRVLRLLPTARFVSQTMVFFISQGRKEDLLMLAELMAAGKLVPVIDRTYPLSGVPEAIRYLEEGHARGKVAITV